MQHKARARTQIFSLYPVPTGIRRYTPPSPLASEQYFAWLSIRVGALVTPSTCPTRSLKLSFACAFSTLSRKFSVPSVNVGIVNLALARAPESAHAANGFSSGSWNAPCPRTATKMHPRAPDGSAAETGRFGQPMTPSWTRASTRRARQTAYCSPRRKPFVPSMGSRVHIPGEEVG